jgi:hypothetical protein
MSELSKIWFNEAKLLKTDEAIFIRVANKPEQTALAREFEADKENFAKIYRPESSKEDDSNLLKKKKHH